MTVTLTMWQLFALAGACTLWGAVIGAAVMLDVMWDRKPRVPGLPLARLADPAPLPGELAPFPADTSPLLLLSESMAAVDGHEREIREMLREADRKMARYR